ncbi:hypothetical protein SacmaDRAFT_4361 [Saccharomonospora marina XMU15]|uniref:EspG family n=1 Tax=Saccharomonospora marina XMU15 TaxID=882083 RepID=H5X8X2_9PSEU|nr:ESX secretion-associated protein EspG [Saccharomonospora marina]EHR52547.1 hypothetical protein SacmaDRAFT_4361 [Saccharomonospora marina XMU15]
MRSGRVDLPLSALAGVVEREGMGSLHLALRPEPMWLPQQERGEAGSRVDKHLAEAGLVDGRGRVDADFLDWLPLLTHASLEYYGWLNHGDSTWSVLTASRGLQGLLAVRRDDRVSLAPVSRHELPQVLVRQLPDLVPGGGTHWSVRVAQLREAGERGPQDRALPSEIREIVKVLRRPVAGGGELYVAERDDVGRYLRLTDPLHYVDTDWGRYLNYTSGRGVEAVVHMAPGEPGAMVSALEELRASLR